MINETTKNKTRNFLWILGLTLIILSLLVIKYFLNQKNDSKTENSTTVTIKESDQAIADNAPTQLHEDDSYQIKAVEEAKISKEVYANLVKQQLQLEALQEKYDTLKNELEKIKNQDKLSKIIISFIDVKDCINLKQNCDVKLQKLELLTKLDANLSSKITTLRAILQTNPKSSEQIKSQFTALIPSLMASEKVANSQSYFDKIKYNLAKLIVIRRVDGAAGNLSQNIDFVISQTEKLINKNQYQEALDLLSAQNENYKPALNEFIADLQNVNQLNKTVDEIFSYLKTV